MTPCTSTVQVDWTTCLVLRHFRTSSVVLRLKSMRTVECWAVTPSPRLEMQVKIAGINCWCTRVWTKIPSILRVKLLRIPKFKHNGLRASHCKKFRSQSRPLIPRASLYLVSWIRHRSQLVLMAQHLRSGKVRSAVTISVKIRQGEPISAKT